MKKNFDDFEDSLDCMNFVNSIIQFKSDVTKLKRQSLHNSSDNRPDPRSIYLENENDMNMDENGKIDDEESKIHNNLLSESRILAVKQNQINRYK